jgi:hypothetical protein
MGLEARGGFAGEDRGELLKIERMLRTFAATEVIDRLRTLGGPHPPPDLLPLGRPSACASR